MVKAVEDVQGSLADSAAGEQVLEQMVAEQEHELGGIKRGDRLKVAAGGPDSSAGESVDMGMEIEAVAVALNGDDDAREGCRIRGNLLEHLPEGLPDRLAEQAEVAAVELEPADSLTRIAQPVWRKRFSFVETGIDAYNSPTTKHYNLTCRSGGPHARVRPDRVVPQSQPTIQLELKP